MEAPRRRRRCSGRRSTSNSSRRRPVSSCCVASAVARTSRCAAPGRWAKSTCEALRYGLEPARITIVGDAPAELEAALREALKADACLVSGGLGPTHDDRTVELLARAAGMELVVDEALEREIESISRAVAER